jgi:Zn finger protein HypA/HybF involved in hydrogenase expression
VLVKIAVYLLSGLIGVLGLIFVTGWQEQTSRLIIGIILLVAAFVLVYLTRVQARTTTTTNIQKIDLSGDVSLEEIRCRSCNAPLSKDEIEVKAGAILVSCEHCGATYQFEEEPKW